MSRLPNSRLVAYALLLLNVALWGMAPPIIKHSLGFVSPSVFLVFRYFIASFLFLPFFLKSNSHEDHQTKPWQIILLALLGTPLTLYPLFLGLNLTSSIEGSLIESTSPIFTVLGGLIFLHEIIKPKEWLGLLIAIVGTLLLTIEPLLGLNHSTFSGFSGNLLILLSNIIWASFLLLSKKAKVNSTKLSFYSFLISIPFFAIIAFLERQPLLPDTRALPGILYMAIFGSIVAFWAYQEGQKRIEASEAAVFSYLKPLFTLPLAILWLHETISPLTIVSSIVILIGVIISEKR